MSNEVDYFEVGSPHPDAARAFYGGLFGWRIGPPSSPAQYAAVEDGKGGLWDSSGIGGGAWAVFYVRVDDVAKAVADAERLGGGVAIPLVDNGAIEFAHLIDLDGNRFGVWKPKD